MSERIEHIEKVERRGGKFVATLHSVEQLGALEIIQVCKGLRNEVINRQDEIKNLENQKTAIDKQIGGQEIAIEALSQRVKTIFEPRLAEAKRLLTKAERKELKAFENQEMELVQQREALVDAYAKAHKTAEELDQKKEFKF